VVENLRVYLFIKSMKVRKLFKGGGSGGRDFDIIKSLIIAKFVNK